ncbi:MAG: hypothetical protein WCB10_05785, partial [Steroidobacteraceae bacterium]
RALEEDESLALTQWRIGRAKFLKPVRPGETLLVEHEMLPNGTGKLPQEALQALAAAHVKSSVA